MGQTTTTHGHVLTDLVPLDKEQTPTETPMGTDSYSTYSHTVMQGPTPVKLDWLQQVNYWEWISLPSEWKVYTHIYMLYIHSTNLYYIDGKEHVITSVHSPLVSNP